MEEMELGRLDMMVNRPRGLQKKTKLGDEMGEDDT